MITIGNHQFEGPYTSVNSLADRSGVYAIIDRRKDGKQFLLDCGESATVKSRVANHDRAGCWQRNAQGAVVVAVRYTPGLQQSGRKLIEQQIRSTFNPTCGTR